MIKLLAALLLAPLSGLAQVQVGQPAPDFTGTDIHGKAHKLSDYRGKIVILEAYNFDCPFCANHYKTGAMQALQSAAVSRGAVWLIVNSTAAANPSYRKPEVARQEVTRQGIQATAWLDDHTGAIGKRYGMKTTPHMFVINPSGVLVYQGAIDDRPESSGDPRPARNYVRQAIESLMAGRPVPLAETQPYGCSVKYAD